MPQGEFEYVVPKETFKEHAKNRRKATSSTHKGATKKASEEEMEEAEKGFVFATPRKRKKHKHHSHHGHHHHRRKFRHLALWKRILIVLAAIILAVVILTGGTFLILHEIGRSSMHSYANAQVIPPSTDEAGKAIIPVDKTGRVITYDGVSEIGSAEGKGGYFTGLVAENNGTLEGITTFATVNFVAGTAAGETGVSCLVGHAGANSVIKDCVNKATLKSSGTVPQVTDFGSIAGYLDKEGAQVINCSNEAKLTVSIKVNKVLHIGGLIGRINGLVTVENCHNKANVTYDQGEAPATWMSIGGVIGSDYNGGTISGCTNTGAVSANTLQVVRIGGIMGVLNKSGSVTNCTNEGTVTLTQEANANWQSAGGIIGFQEASQTNDKDNIISGNTNKGAVTVSVENTTTHANKVAAGGILGEGCLALSVTGNTNTAAVKVTNKAAGAVYAGGIYGALIKNKQPILSSGNVNTGAVSAATSDNASAMAGGVVGYVAAASGGDANTVTLTLSGEKSTGAVTCANADMAGAIAGNNASAKLENCIAGGSVNGKSVSDANVGDLVQGPASKGEATGTTVAK